MINSNYSGEERNNKPEKKWNERLHELKEYRYLTRKIFRVSENMHYEIFRYLNCVDLLEVKSACLGGYQLTSNTLLRDRIKNYFCQFRFNPKESSNVEGNLRKLQIAIEQTGKAFLQFDNMRIGQETLLILSHVIKRIPKIEGIDLSIYIYYYDYTTI